MRCSELCGDSLVDGSGVNSAERCLTIIVVGFLSVLVGNEKFGALMRCD